MKGQQVTIHDNSTLISIYTIDLRVWMKGQQVTIHDNSILISIYTIDLRVWMKGQHCIPISIYTIDLRVWMKGQQVSKHHQYRVGEAHPNIHLYYRPESLNEGSASEQTSSVPCRGSTGGNKHPQLASMFCGPKPLTNGTNKTSIQT